MPKPKKGKAKAELPRSADDRLAIIHLKGTRAYAEWLEEAHRQTRFPKATMFRMAMEEWAEKRGLKKPPEF
jgi:hypothetical protein